MAIQKWRNCASPYLCQACTTLTTRIYHCYPQLSFTDRKSNPQNQRLPSSMSIVSICEEMAATLRAQGDPNQKNCCPNALPKLQHMHMQSKSSFRLSERLAAGDRKTLEPKLHAKLHTTQSHTPLSGPELLKHFKSCSGGLMFTKYALSSTQYIDHYAS